MILFELRLTQNLLLLISMFIVVNSDRFNDCHISQYGSGSDCGDCLKIEQQPCFRKCCPLGEVYINDTCVESGISSESITIELVNGLRRQDYPLRTIKNIIYGVTCRGVNRVFPVDRPYTLYTDGRLLMSEGFKNMYEYCGDIMDGGSEITLQYCFNGYEEITNYDYFFSFILFVSFSFLIMTVIVFLLVDGMTENLASKIVLSHLFTMIINFLLLVSVKIIGISRFGRVVCYIFGYAVHYTFLANFFWLNVMCFDIGLVFSGWSMPYRNLTKWQERRKFFRYSLYAWGSPLLICGLTYIADITLSKDSVLKPDVGKDSCLLSERGKAFYYFLPLTILLIINVAMFLVTAYNINKHKKQMRVLQSAESNINNPLEKERLNLYIKLFLVMGITWIFEPLSAAFDNKPEMLWLITDSINALQGIPIFLIFVCKQRTMNTLNSKFCPSLNILCCFSDGPTSVLPTTVSTSSTTVSIRYKAPNEDNGSRKLSTEAVKVSYKNET